VEQLRAEFPLLERVAYLNAGTNGPVPRRAADAAAASLRAQADAGRGGRAFFEATQGRADDLRGDVAPLLGCGADEVALTTSTTDGVNAALTALELRPGDEVLTSDEEHPGLLAPLAMASRRRGVRLRVVPFADLADAVTPGTRLVACSHVSWKTGRIVDAAGLAATGTTVLLDGAQGLGAVSVDVRALGCHFYAASGQKWLCGPNGIGYLYVRGELVESLPAPWPGYHALADAAEPLESPLKDDASRLSTGYPAPHQVEFALAALGVVGAPEASDAAIRAAGALADLLAARGVAVAPRGESTLVSFEVPDPEDFTARAAEAGVVVRGLPGTPWARASVGAWTNDDDLERLMDAL
jgi:L-cysteine/cystine lyase